jgi:Flp pilus assembly CpaE family ATPase
METPILMFTAKTQMNDKVIGFEVGANDYLTKPTHPSELQARVKALLARASEKKGEGASARDDGNGFVIGVISARGGLGATTVALNVAAGLHARTKSEVIVAETLPGRGALALELGMAASHGLADLLSQARLTDITRDKVRQLLMHHTSGIKVLLASDRPRDMHLISQSANYEAIAAKLGGLARFTLLDLGAGLQPFTQVILPHCDEIFIILEGNPNTIINTKALIEDLHSFGVNITNIHPVLNNRIRSDTQLPTSQVQAKLGHEIITTLTPAPELFVQATRLQTAAVLSQPESLTARQFGKLVDFIVEREAMPR